MRHIDHDLDQQPIQESPDLRRDAERGAGLAEYALVLFLVALVAVTTLTAMGGTIQGLFSESNVILGGQEVVPEEPTQ
ncbi:MAG: Flp family type IVb pilin [Acidimicrobiales bacterium]